VPIAYVEKPPRIWFIPRQGASGKRGHAVNRAQFVFVVAGHVTLTLWRRPDEAHVDDHRVGDVLGSLKWYQALFGQPATLPGHDYFGQILASDGTVLLCLHEWGAHEHPSLMSPDHGTPGNGLLLSFVSMISTWRFKGHALSSLGSKRSHT
jgi:hypothetical protein